jgi:LPS export ABC transporter protein LptC
MAFFIFTMLRYLYFVVLTFVFACSKTNNAQPAEYTGPLREAEGVELFYSENQRIKVKMKAPLVYEFQNGDREFPKSIYLEFFDETGALSSTLKADHAFYFKKENQWRARGHVEVINQAKNEQLNTEELFWKPAEEVIFTESFVTIRQQNDVIYGQGLEAKQDMSSYSIKKPQGEIEIKEEDSKAPTRARTQ